MDQIRYGSSLKQVHFKRSSDRRAGSVVTQGGKEFHLNTHIRLMNIGQCLAPAGSRRRMDSIPNALRFAGAGCNFRTSCNLRNRENEFAFALVQPVFKAGCPAGVDVCCYSSAKTESNALSGTSKTWLCGGSGSNFMNSGTRSAALPMPAASLNARSFFKM